MENLKGKRIAILTDSGFEESELVSPKQALEAAGAITEVVSPTSGVVKGWKDGNWSINLPVDIDVADANPDLYDALLIPGGVINPDLLRRNEDCVAFATSFLQAGKPVGAICHGPQLLIETGLLDGRMMTSFSSIKTDLVNAGADWVDREVVVDQGLVTSRSPKDLLVFNANLVEEIAEGVHETR